MSRHATTDQDAADRERHARARLLAGGADSLPRPPWLATGQPPADIDLARHLLWRCNTRPHDVAPEDVQAGLSLLSAVRSEVDQIEAALLFTARAEGMTWAKVAEGLGLRTGQAAQQRCERVLSRLHDGTEQL